MFCPLFMTCPLFGMSAIGKFHFIHHAQLCLFRNIQQHHSRPEACNFIKKGSLAQVFSCEFCEFLRIPFFTEHLRWQLLYFVKNDKSLMTRITSLIIFLIVLVHWDLLNIGFKCRKATLLRLLPNHFYWF